MNLRDNRIEKVSKEIIAFFVAWNQPYRVHKVCRSYSICNLFVILS